MKKVIKFLLLVAVVAMTSSLFAQTNTMLDVVYCKNGSVIKGVIIEQIPNQSIKIQTSDGNIFVYSMEDVEKITKEQVAVKSNEKVSLSIIDSDEVIETKYTNKYKSVIVFGKARIIENKNEVYKNCVQMAKAICPHMDDNGIKEETERFINETAVVEITPEHITGKEGLEFYKLRK